MPAMVTSIWPPKCLNTDFKHHPYSGCYTKQSIDQGLSKISKFSYTSSVVSGIIDGTEPYGMKIERSLEFICKNESFQKLTS